MLLGWGKRNTFKEGVLFAVPDVPSGTSGTTLAMNGVYCHNFSNLHQTQLIMEEKSKVDKWIYYFKNNKYTAPIIFISIVFMGVCAFGKNISESFFNNKALETKVSELNSRMDTIKQSLSTYNFILVNSKVVPTENNMYYSKNAAGTVYGQVGDVYNQTKTYNQTKIDKQIPIPPIASKNIADNTHSVEIISICNPVIKTSGSEHKVVFTLKTKNMEEANNVNSFYSVINKNKGHLEIGDKYPNNNSSIITNYPTEFSYEFIPSDKIDTFYFFLKLNLTNNLGQPQIPFQVLFRKCNSSGDKLIRIFTGTKEYKEILENIFQSNGMIIN